MEVIVQPSCQLKGESVVVAECFILSFHSGHSQVHRSDLSSSSDNKHVSTQKTIMARKPQRRLSVSCQFWTPSLWKEHYHHKWGHFCGQCEHRAWHFSTRNPHNPRRGHICCCMVKGGDLNSNVCICMCVHISIQLKSKAKQRPFPSPLMNFSSPLGWNDLDLDRVPFAKL